jgi:hypothetical protein
MIRAAAVPFPLVALVLALSACGDSTVLTGPDAEAAFAESQAALEAGGEVNIRFTPSSPSLSGHVIVVDGERVTDQPEHILREIRPEDIERIEVHKRCRAEGYLGAEADGGLIMIFTKSYDAESGAGAIEFDADRAAACEARREPSGT